MGLSRWISSMKSTSPGLRFVRSPARSPGLSSTGPEVTFSWECISLAIILASVVLPSPGGPCSSTWSSESPRMRAAWMKMCRFSTIFSCPEKFWSSCGRILFSNSRSLSMFRIVDIATKAIIYVHAPAFSKVAPFGETECSAVGTLKYIDGYKYTSFSGIRRICRFKKHNRCRRRYENLLRK